MTSQVKSHHRTARTLACLCACLLCLALLAGCNDFVPKNDAHTELCHRMMRHVIANDFESAYTLVRAAGSKEDFRVVFEALRTLMNGSDSYELEQTGWYVNIKEGVTSYTSTFQVNASGGAVILLQIKTVEGIEGMASFYLHDATEFAQGVGRYKGINVAFILLWIASLAFTVWMLVDCIRRRIKKRKALWIIAILLGLSLTLTMGESGVNFGFNLGTFLSISQVKAVIPSLSVVYSLYLPIGAIAYLIARKRITYREEPILPGTEEIPTPSAESQDYFPAASDEETEKGENE